LLAPPVGGGAGCGCGAGCGAGAGLPLAHCTGSQSAGTMFGAQSDCAVCSIRQLKIVPWKLTRLPTL
jgi:hypothetical protein